MSDKPRIMVVDDTPANLRLIEQLLVDDGYNVFCFPRGDLAVKSALRNKPDLILLDINMPVMDGYEVCKTLKAERKTEDIPVIFISAYNSTSDKVKGFRAGGVDFITKPFDIEEVRARVQTHLKIHTLENDLRNMNTRLVHTVQRQFHELAEAKYATIIALAQISESRDADIGNHLERVRMFCRFLTEKLALRDEYRQYITPTYVENITLASLLHDIGKIGIEDRVLKKTGKLTVEEFDQMKKHTKIGADTLKSIMEKYPRNAFLQMGISIAKSHHERWDGKGYPDGLVGDEIPLSARIMAIVDVYDALRSKRCYKEPLTHEYALLVIEEAQGKHFDPNISEVFLEHAKEFERLYDELSD